tara:strand:- start:167 stop:352 length:186 start_codon:yes stop_codon:yes gene_type:complete
MDLIFNYLFIGCILSFALDHYTLKYQEKIQDWTWSARILFIVFWPLGAITFVLNLINESNK